jgi:hypothetical protein
VPRRYGAHLESHWDSKKRHLPKKKWNCAFGNAKKHGLIFQFSLFNRFFSLELRTPFSKSMFWQKSQNLTMLPNGPKLEGRNVLRRYSIGLMLDI